MTTRRMLLLLAGLLLLGWLAWLAAPGEARSTTVLTARVEGPITPVVADHLKDGVQRAAREGHQAFLVEMDTPGGLLTSTDRIVSAFLNTGVPVVVYVAPTGARAASAGTFITFAADVAAMAPGTTIGAATPVSLQGGQKAEGKIVEYSAARIRSIAQQRGRNVGFAEETVRKGRAVTSEDALKLNAINLIAADRAQLLEQLDGREVKLGTGQTVTLRTADAAVVAYDMGAMRKLLQLLADPNLAFLLLSIGTLAVIYELATPGIGVFAGGGVITLLLAGMFLFEDSIRVSPAVLWPTALLVGGGTLLAGRLAWRARRAEPTSGKEMLLAAEGVVRRAEGRTGQVFVEGAWWSARAAEQPLSDGQHVRVVAVEDLTLIVEPIEEPS